MKVEIIVTAYNHAAFIEEAVHSILAQETLFAYKVTVIDDFSSDQTRDLLLALQRHEPDRIRLVLCDENRNDDREFIQAIQKSEAEYLAVLDGDDYWTSKHKLQEQVNFLDRWTACSVCFHDAIVVDADGKIIRPYNDPKPPPRSTLDDLVLRNFIPTCGMMFRRRALREVPEWFFGTEQSDWLLNMLCAINGDIGYIDEEWGVYRIHGGGYWSGVAADRYRWATIRMLTRFNAHTNFRHDGLIRIVLFKCYGYLALFYFWNRDRQRAGECLRKCLQSRPPVSHSAITELLRGLKRELRSWSGR